MKQKETAAVLMVLLAAACWGANGIFINILTAYGVNGTQMTLVRMASMAILTGIWLAAKNPAALKIDLRDLVWFVPAGALGLFMFGLFYTYSIQLVGMGTAAVLIYLMPSLVMLFSVVFLHEKFTPGKGLCLVLSLLGCALVSGVAGAGCGRCGLRPWCRAVLHAAEYSAGHQAEKVQPDDKSVLHVPFQCSGKPCVYRRRR